MSWKLNRDIAIVMLCSFIVPVLIFVGQSVREGQVRKRDAIDQLSLISVDINNFVTSFVFMKRAALTGAEYDRRKSSEFYRDALVGESRHVYIFTLLKLNFPAYESEIVEISSLVSNFYRPEIDRVTDKFIDEMDKKADDILLSIDGLVAKLSKRLNYRENIVSGVSLIIPFVALLAVWRKGEE